MSKDNESLILKEKTELEATPFLFSDEQLPEIDKTQRRFHCTGERLYRDRPDIYRGVVRMLAEPGVSIRSICATLHVTDDTVRAVKERENIPIAAEKKAVLTNVTYGLRLASERVIELMPEASARDALIGVGILGDKMALLGGQPTIRVEVGQCIDVGAELQRLLDEAEKLIKQAQVTEIDLDRKSPEQKALANGDNEQACNLEKPSTN